MKRKYRQRSILTEDQRETNFLLRLKATENGCVEFQGSRDKRGYGRFTVGYQVRMLAHRYAMQRLGHALKDGICVLHRCDNPPCCNPDHLFLGTKADNAVDMAKKWRGNSHPRPTSLTREQVREIRMLPCRIEASYLAEHYGVNRPVIYKVLYGRSHEDQLYPGQMRKGYQSKYKSPPSEQP